MTELKQQIKTFRVYPQYRELEEDADRLTQELNTLANGNTVDTAAVRDLEAALHIESPPSLENLEAVYKEAGITLPSIALKRFDEVQSFHESVVRNREYYLNDELTVIQERVKSRERQKEKLDRHRAEIMTILESHGALEQYSQLQGERGKQEAEVAALQQRFESAEQLEGTKNQLKIDRNRLVLRLLHDFRTQSQRLDEAIVGFEKTSTQLYESAGSMTVDTSDNGPVFEFPMQGASSKGIKSMQIFCFDMMMMRLCAQRHIGPGFLIHDSHLFDGVDGRQVVSALQIGAKTAEELGFQYIVTMNEDDVFKEKIKSFSQKNYILPVKLTDANDTGGLFGCRF